MLIEASNETRVIFTTTELRTSTWMTASHEGDFRSKIRCRSGEHCDGTKDLDEMNVLESNSLKGLIITIQHDSHVQSRRYHDGAADIIAGLEPAGSRWK